MTQTTLSLSDDLCLPLDIAGEVVGILAKRGAGKTNTGAVLVEELQDAVYRMVSGPQAALLQALVVAYPEPLDRETLADRAGVSALSSGFRNNVSKLSSLEMLTYPEPGLVRASDLLFLEDAVAA